MHGCKSWLYYKAGLKFLYTYYLSLFDTTYPFMKSRPETFTGLDLDSEI